MKEADQLKNCANCGNKLNEKFCGQCGHPRELVRIDGQYILSEIGRVLNFDKGILFTIRELLLRPGKSIRRFIFEDRSRLIKPIIFIIVTSLIYTIAQRLLHFEDGYVEASFPDKQSARTSIFIWIQANYGYANLMMSFFIALWIKVFFRKYNYNFFEIIILLCFVMGVGMLMYTFFGVLETMTGIKVLQLGGIIGLIYTSWAIGRFFDGSKKVNYLKSFLSYFLGMISFFGLAILLGIVVDMLIK